MNSLNDGCFGRILLFAQYGGMNPTPHLRPYKPFHALDLVLPSSFPHLDKYIYMIILIPG